MMVSGRTEVVQALRGVAVCTCVHACACVCARVVRMGD